MSNEMEQAAIDAALKGECEKWFYEEYELKQAAWMSVGIVGAILLLMAAYWVMSYFSKPIPLDPTTGLPTEIVKDPWTLTRSMFLKCAGVLGGSLAVAWGLLGLNHILPGDMLKKITEESIACAIFAGFIVHSLATLWCYG